MTTPHAPRENFSKPSAARLYDLYLGGTHNYDVDRTFAAEAFRLCPFLPDMARQNRGFLRRAAQYMAESGVDQFLDIGSGVPTVDNVHQIVHSVNPDARVVYVDNDNEAVVSSLKLLQGETNVKAIYGDLRDPDFILRDPTVGAMLDFDRPIGLLIVAVIHFIGHDEKPYDLISRYVDALAPGSYFAASHITVDEMAPEARQQLEALEREYGRTANPATLRSKDEFLAFFNGLEIVGPDTGDESRRDAAYAADWRPTERVAADNPARPSWWAAVGRKPLALGPARPGDKERQGYSPAAGKPSNEQEG